MTVTAASGWFRRTATGDPCPGRLRTRLSAAGWGFLVLLLCGFLMSINFSNNLIFAMTFLLAGIAAVGWWRTRVNLRGLRPSDWRGEAVFAGQSVTYHLALENPTPIERYDIRSAGPGLASGAARFVPARGQAELICTRPAAERGLLPARPMVLESRFPLGLFRATLETGSLPETLVYPAPAGVQPLPAHAPDKHAHLRREAGSFTDLRRYAPGDPVARLDWRALARCDALYTREFDGAEGLSALWLDWDAVRAADPEARLSQLCRWVQDAHRQGREYGLAVGATRLAPAAGEAHRRRCLRALALYGRDAEVTA